MTAVLEGHAMRRASGSIVVALSAAGYPLTQLVIRRWGVRGAAAAECVCAGLAIRDASMVASGVPGRLRRFPAALLRLELAVGVVATLAGLHPLVSARSAGRSASARACAVESVRGGPLPRCSRCTRLGSGFAFSRIGVGLSRRPDAPRGQAPCRPGSVGGPLAVRHCSIRKTGYLPAISARSSSGAFGETPKNSRASNSGDFE